MGIEKEERLEEFHGVHLFISETYDMEIYGLDIYLHPQYELVTKQVIKQLAPKIWNDGELTSENLKIHLKNFVPSLQ